MSSSLLNGEPSWSPVQSLPPATLTPSGLLQLDADDGEVELMRRDMVELKREGDPLPNPGMGGAWMDRNVNLTLTLTTHRMVFATNNKNNNQTAKTKGGAWFLHHSNVHNIASTGGGMFFKTAKTVLSTYALGDLLLTFRGNPHKDRDDLQKLLQKALDRKAWETTERLANKQQKAAVKQQASRKVGVDAILAKNALRHKEAAKLTDVAFDGDAESLLSEAAELVKIIQKYVSTLEHSGEGNNPEQAQLTDMLSNMGMTSALSKSEMSQTTFHQLLARQLADFLLPKLKAASGVMTLTDVYCLFNRARGTNLISPDDMLHAASLLSELSLQMSLHTFPSGVKVIQQDAFDDVTMATKLKQMASSSNQSCLTSMQVSRDLHIPSLLAQEQLLAAERLGYLCRDVTLETTRFYPNRFIDEY